MYDEIYTYGYIGLVYYLKIECALNDCLSYKFLSLRNS